MQCLCVDLGKLQKEEEEMKDANMLLKEQLYIQPLIIVSQQENNSPCKSPCLLGVPCEVVINQENVENVASIHCKCDW